MIALTCCNWHVRVTVSRRATAPACRLPRPARARQTHASCGTLIAPGCTESLTNLPPNNLSCTRGPWRVHIVRSLLTSRINETCARLHSRVTGSGDTFNSSAVPSTVSRPKKRSSTTGLFRGSTSASALSASSSATRSHPESPSMRSAVVECDLPGVTAPFLVPLGPGLRAIHAFPALTSCRAHA
jgi:hypothetical protein